MTGLPIACLLSDCDGVIVDSEHIAEAILLEVLERAFEMRGLSGELRDMVGLRVVDIIRTIEGRLGKPQTESRRAALQREIDSRVAEAALPMPGTFEAYRSLGLPVAVVSNSAYARLHLIV